MSGLVAIKDNIDVVAPNSTHTLAVSTVFSRQESPDANTEVLVSKRITLQIESDSYGISKLIVGLHGRDKASERGRLELDFCSAPQEVRLKCQELINWASTQGNSRIDASYKVEERFLKSLEDLASAPEHIIGIQYKNNRGLEAISKIPISTEADRRKAKDVPDPVFLRDSHTGCFGAAYLSYAGSLDKLSTKISGPKLMLFLDVNNVSAGNRFGLREEVDSFFSSDKLGKLVKNCFGEKSELVRLGGDEFVLIIEDKGDQVTNEGVINFLAAWETLRSDIFKANDPRTILAEEYSALRFEMKKLRSQFESSLIKTEKPNEKDYCKWLKAQAATEIDAKAQDGESLNSGHLALNIARKLAMEGEPRPRLMTVSSSVPIRLGEMLTVNSVHAALRTAQREIERAKMQGGINSFDAIDPDLQLIVRHSELRLEDTVFRVEQAFRQYRELVNGTDESYPSILLELDLTDLRCAAFQDPSVNHDVQRYNLLKDSKVGEILNIQDKVELALTFIDISHFGVVNHLSYERADELYGELAGLDIKIAKPKFALRVNGGGLLLISEAGLSSDIIAEIQRKSNDFLTEQLKNETRAQIEINERNALNAHFNKDVNQRSFGTVNIRQFHVKANASDTIETMLKQVL